MYLNTYLQYKHDQLYILHNNNNNNWNSANTFVHVPGLGWRSWPSDGNTSSCDFVPPTWNDRSIKLPILTLTLPLLRLALLSRSQGLHSFFTCCTFLSRRFRTCELYDYIHLSNDLRSAFSVGCRGLPDRSAILDSPAQRGVSMDLLLHLKWLSTISFNTAHVFKKWFWTQVHSNGQQIAFGTAVQ